MSVIFHSSQIIINGKYKKAIEFNAISLDGFKTKLCIDGRLGIKECEKRSHQDLNQPPSQL
jgi:hypothetical protein